MHRSAAVRACNGITRVAQALGIPFDCREQSAFHDPLIDIEPQDVSCTPSFRGQSLDDQSVEPEVLGPVRLVSIGR